MNVAYIIELPTGEVLENLHISVSEDIDLEERRGFTNPVWEVWYAKEFKPYFGDNEPPNPPEDLTETHHKVAKVYFANHSENVYARFEDIWMIMNVRWSPNGEMNDLIKESGTDHTSMSIGDVIVAPDGTRYMTETMGFDKIVLGR
jgi:hypothetical protein|tara:strand:- start:451 stop:888 length:438 start_codon:yes stop_codon:yes gene_type:complete